MSFELKKMEQLEDNFKISDKQLMILIENLFEMISSLTVFVISQKSFAPFFRLIPVIFLNKK